MSQNSEQYTKDFLKGQEIPTTSPHGYFQGNLPLAGKYPASARRDGNPQGVKKIPAHPLPLRPPSPHLRCPVNCCRTPLAKNNF